MTKKEIENELWHKLGKEYAPHSVHNAQQLWENWKNHQAQRWVWSTVCALILFSACYAVGLDEWWQNGPIALLGGFALFRHLRRSMLSLQEEGMAREWGEIRKGVSQLQAWEYLAEACYLNELLVTHPHTSKYYPSCVKEILLIKEAILKRRIATNAGRWWLQKIAKS